jgi:MoxR-like ATPase
VSWGAGPRGVQYLLLGGKARAALAGRLFVTVDDIRAVARPVLRHRVITNFNAESSGISPDKVIERLISEMPERRPGDEIPPAVERALA